MRIQSLLGMFSPWSHNALLYEVTPRCNLRCLHCYNVWKDDVGYGQEELSPEQALKLVDKAIQESHCRHFTFTGGEPLLRNDLEALVKLARKHCDQVVLITNGTLLTETRIKGLIKAGVTLFELPLNAGERAAHDLMAGSSDCFDKVTQAAAEIRYHGGAVAFVFVATSHNAVHWEKALELGIALGARSFLYNRYNAGGACHGKPEALMPSLKQVQEGLRIAEKFAKSHGVGIGASIAIPPCLIDPKDFPHVGFGFCAAGTDRAYYTIDPMGNVRPCNHTPTILGNLLETSLRELVKSPKLQQFMKARPPFCAGCSIEEQCLGGCKAAAETCYGSLTACDPFLELNKTQAHKKVASASAVLTYEK
jgi:radical SAM protein with 4Fe4S-binding SPASM domain